MASIIAYISLGIFAGFASGLIGIGGGVILIPALVFIFGLTQHQAQGTTLALFIPPIGLLAVFNYYKGGHINWKMALFICLGFFVGGFFGSKLAVEISTTVLRKIFGCFLLMISMYFLIKK